jgi:hypothetical protein
LGKVLVGPVALRVRIVESKNDMVVAGADMLMVN